MAADKGKVKRGGHSTGGRCGLTGARMAEKSLPPEDCRSMAEVRAGVDALDAEIMRLLARRFAYMRAAARIKSDRSQVRDEARKAEVMANATALARDFGIPPERIAELWERLVETSIAYELEEWDRSRA
jgi:isochorismate pyruvate lyase